MHEQECSFAYVTITGNRVLCCCTACQQSGIRALCVVNRNAASTCVRPPSGLVLTANCSTTVHTNQHAYAD